jgi:hypothetical protein
LQFYYLILRKLYLSKSWENKINNLESKNLMEADYKPIDQSKKEILVEYYKDSNKKLQDLLGIKISEWD